MTSALMRCWNNKFKPLGLQKPIMTVVLTAILSLIYIAPALADTPDQSEWIHGNYTFSTDSCGVCHNTHQANGRYLTTFTTTGSTNDIYQNCTFCHSPLGSSKYDEVDGTINGTGLDTNGNKIEPHTTAAGGFEKMPAEITDFSGSGPQYSYTPVTSNHQVNQPDGTLVKIPGGTLAGSDTMELTCTSCHTPHGKTDNSKLLRIRLDEWDPVQNDRKALPTPQVVTDSSMSFNNAISDFCIACHTDYLKNTSQYRHPVAQAGSTSQVLASSASGFNPQLLSLPVSSTGEVTCLTCHSAHGTVANVSATTYTPQDPVRSSTLLRLDERGVCQNCHNKTSNTSQPSLDSSKSFETSDPSHVVITFSNYVSKTLAEDPLNYAVTITGDTGVSITEAKLQPNPFFSKQVLLTLNKPITSGKAVKITVSNLKDLNGNMLAAGGNQLSFTGK